MGGTFDPIHAGHLIVANEALHALNLTEVLFVPAARPWQKEPQVDAEHRLAMVQAAIAGEPRFSASTVDIDREGNTWLRPIIASKAIEKSGSGVEVVPGKGIDWALEHKIIVSRIDAKGVAWIAEAGRAAAEAKLANHVHRAMVESLPAAGESKS